MSEDYTIRQIDLPPSVHALTVLDEEGHYNIYINDRLDNNMRITAVKHELKHITHNHFYDKSLSLYEKENCC